MDHGRRKSHTCLKGRVMKTGVYWISGTTFLGGKYKTTMDNTGKPTLHNKVENPAF
jgi:hypothetical protein